MFTDCKLWMFTHVHQLFTDWRLLSDLIVMELLYATSLNKCTDVGVHVSVLVYICAWLRSMSFRFDNNTTTTMIMMMEKRTMTPYLSYSELLNETILHTKTRNPFRKKCPGGTSCWWQTSDIRVQVDSRHLPSLHPAVCHLIHLKNIHWFWQAAAVMSAQAKHSPTCVRDAATWGALVSRLSVSGRRNLMSVRT